MNKLLSAFRFSGRGFDRLTPYSTSLATVDPVSYGICLPEPTRCV
jgi:hypothetical protein